MYKRILPLCPQSAKTHTHTCIACLVFVLSPQRLISGSSTSKHRVVPYRLFQTCRCCHSCHCCVECFFEISLLHTIQCLSLQYAVARCWQSLSNMSSVRCACICIILSFFYQLPHIFQFSVAITQPSTCRITYRMHASNESKRLYLTENSPSLFSLNRAMHSH